MEQDGRDDQKVVHPFSFNSSFAEGNNRRVCALLCLAVPLQAIRTFGLKFIRDAIKFPNLVNFETEEEEGETSSLLS